MLIKAREKVSLSKSQVKGLKDDYSSPSLSEVSLSVLSVTHAQLRFEKIKWKIPKTVGQFNTVCGSASCDEISRHLV